MKNIDGLYILFLIKKNKRYVSPQDFPKPIYPHYANGATYLLTSKAVKSIMNATDNVHAFPIEDVLYTGILANLSKVKKFSVWEHFRIGKNVRGFYFIN
jgi:hypothetical protein